jgi:cell division protein ZapA (FtsZ GTPase activity inhibitor)
MFAFKCTFKHNICKSTKYLVVILLINVVHCLKNFEKKNYRIPIALKEQKMQQAPN